MAIVVFVHGPMYVSMGITMCRDFLHTRSAEHIPDPRDKNNDREGQERCKQNSPRILIQHCIHHFIISISPTSTVFRLRYMAIIIAKATAASAAAKVIMKIAKI